MAGKTTLGISLYPDFYSIEECKMRLDQAKLLGYTRVFTSIQLGDLGFEHTKNEISDEFRFLFNYSRSIGMTCHVDINDTMLKEMGASVHNLEPVKLLNIPIIRLDGGFTKSEIAEMTKNPYGIIIEENLSNLTELNYRLNEVSEHGNLNQYFACHNFFPRNDCGLTMEDALAAAELYKNAGCKVGIFICSLYSKNDLNAVGHGVPTLESHRYLPAFIQASELLAHNIFDYIIFGDSDPRLDELEEVAAMNHSVKDVIIENQVNQLDVESQALLDQIPCIDIPVYWENLTNEQIALLESLVFLSRNDKAAKVVRATQSRGVFKLAPLCTIKRSKLAITIDNEKANRYTGELQIMLTDLEAVDYANVVGMVKPYASHLVKAIHEGKVAFRLNAQVKK